MREKETQIERIARYEALFDRLREMTGEISGCPGRIAEIEADVRALSEYYTGKEWREDYEADEKGLLPKTLKRGVLSEDGVYDLLGEIDSLRAGIAPPDPAGKESAEPEAGEDRKKKAEEPVKKIDVAAYIWPAYTGDEMRSRIFWEEGIGEWQTVKNAAPKENGYDWGRRSLWGYPNEADPEVMEFEIGEALRHGVNVFIYDWYWYDGRPFLENCLNDGFLKAKNNRDMRFFLMWANHDAGHTWDRRNAGRAEATVWRGAVDRKTFETVGRRWIEKYFRLPNYCTVGGKPVVSIYDLNNFISGLGGVREAKEAMAWLDREAAKEGLPGVHFQFIRWNGKSENVTGVDGGVIETTPALVEELGFSSLTHYQFVHFADIDRPYREILPDVTREWEKIAREFALPYWPHVSIGWDNNPRFLDFRPGIVRDNEPAEFEKALRCAKDFAAAHGAPMVTVNSWNEWTETSFLEPDSKYGYGYLEAVKRVFGGIEEESGKTLVRFYEPDEVPDEKLKFAVILAEYRGKAVFCRHKERRTWEIAGGHREKGETIRDTAARELREETGAESFTLSPVCVYSVTSKDNFDGQETFGFLFHAKIETLTEDLRHEIGEILVTDRLPEEWTYPEIQPRLLREAERRGFAPGFAAEE